MNELYQSIIIIGNGGHARSIADIGLHNNLNCLFVDNQAAVDAVIFGFPCVQQIPDNFDLEKCLGFIVGIGDNSKRASCYTYFSKTYRAFNVIANTAWIGTETQLGQGIFIGNSAHIGPSAKIGNNTIINTAAIVEHDAIVGRHSHVAINATIAGCTKIGDFTFIGAGATVIDNIVICDHVIIGAGAVVVKNITEPGIYVGIPATKI